MALSILYWANYVDGLTKIKRKSEAAVESGRVLKFVLDELRVINAYVQASMKDTSYKVQIFLEADDNGFIKTSSCGCPMGEYKCHHVAATLLYGYKRASKTDIKCSWLKHPKSAPPKCTTTMQELYPHRALKRGVTEEDRSYMYDQLGKLGRFTALHWILAKVPVIEDILLSQEYVDAECKQSFLRKKLVLTPEKIMATAFLTVGQQKNGVWAIVRKLRLTASNFGPIIRAIRRNRLTPSLKKRLLSAYNLEKRAPIQWGLTYEETAVQQYCTVASVNVVKTGIWLHGSGVLGASPDGFVQGCPSNIQVHPQFPGQSEASPDIVEVKCPFSAKSMKIAEACVSLKEFFLCKFIAPS